MEAQWIVLGVIVFLIVSKLVSVLGRQPETEKIRFVSDAGDVLEMTLASGSKKGAHQDQSAFDEEDFLMGAKMAFNSVADAFARAQKDVLKPLLSSAVLKVFSKDIDGRLAKGETMDFSLISFVSSQVVSKSAEKSPLKVTVDFVTEQTNALKNKKGETIEGDSIMITKVHDVWTFERAKPTGSWIVAATKSEAFNG